MKFIIAGYGFVGKAVVNAFKNKHDLTIVDPAYNEEKIIHNIDADGLIICAPTPSNTDGTCNADAIFDILQTVPAYMPVLIKSTVTPEVAKSIINQYCDHSIVFSPEFLRARSANQDFLTQKYVVIGGEDPDYFWHEVFQTTLPSCSILFHCTIEEACMVKYATNSFLALKTSFFNQIFDLCTKTGLDFDTVRQIIASDQRIGAGHTMVPGPDGEYGWGGACFPKDTTAFVQWADAVGSPATLVESAINYNNKVRKNT